MNYRDLAERAIWTAVQAFLAVFLAADFGALPEAKSAAAAGAIAAVSAVLSLVKNLARQRLISQPEVISPEPEGVTRQAVANTQTATSEDDPNTELFQGE